MRTRSRSIIKKRAELKFPVRIRVKVPPQGFGLQLDQIHEWLSLRFGMFGYAVASDNQPGVEAMTVYLPDVVSASELVSQFGLELVLLEEVRLT